LLLRAVVVVAPVVLVDFKVVGVEPVDIEPAQD
jgi:hypothetical protein